MSTRHKIFFFSIIAVLLAMPVAAETEGDPGLSVGVQASDFEAVTYEGKYFRLSDYYESGPVVLVFYRGGWCMYCNRQLQEIQSRLAEFDANGASVVAVSVDLQENAAETVNDKQLDFTVISNPKADVLEAYNLGYHIAPDVAKKYKKEYKIDLQAYSGRADYLIAVPGTYVIDTTGTIRYGYANRDYKVRPALDDVLNAVRAIVE